MNTDGQAPAASARGEEFVWRTTDLPRACRAPRATRSDLRCAQEQRWRVPPYETWAKLTSPDCRVIISIALGGHLKGGNPSDLRGIQSHARTRARTCSYAPGCAGESTGFEAWWKAHCQLRGGLRRSRLRRPYSHLRVPGLGGGWRVRRGASGRPRLAEVGRGDRTEDGGHRRFHSPTDAWITAPVTLTARPTPSACPESGPQGVLCGPLHYPVFTPARPNRGKGAWRIPRIGLLAAPLQPHRPHDRVRVRGDVGHLRLDGEGGVGVLQAVAGDHADDGLPPQVPPPPR